jgi:hypothetical protein
MPSGAATKSGVIGVLWTIIVVLLVLWLLGFSFHIAGSLIHLLLVIAAIVLVIELVRMFTGGARVG